MREILSLGEDLIGELWKFDRQLRSPLHTHDELEFNLCTAGRATYLVRGQKVVLSKGTLLWLFPEEDHVLLEASVDFSMWIGVYRQSVVATLAQEESRKTLADPLPASIQLRQLRVAAASRLDDLLEGVFGTRSSPDAFNLGAQFALLVAWDAFLRSESADLGQGVHPAVRHAAHILRRNPALTGCELANEVGLSASHLSRLFSQQLNVSMVRYRQERLVERFLELARRRPQDTALDIALDAGFGSYAQFYRVFLSVYGKTPSSFLANRTHRDGG